MVLLLGYDVGSSSIKATLMEAETGQVVATATSPEKELEIIAQQAGWAEQHPHIWWDIGAEKCLKNLFNLPGNFTASKLRWVKENEPEIYSKIHKIMLPGDYIAMKMTDQIRTTPSGLSEGIMWDFETSKYCIFQAQINKKTKGY